MEKSGGRMKRNYYQILQLKVDATDTEIKNAFRRLAKLYHPDINKSPDAHHKFIEISEAYEFLINHKQYITSQSTGRSKTQKPKPDYDDSVRKAKERANAYARMKYENLQREHEAFKKRGMHDLVLLFKYFLNVFQLIAAFACIALPFVVAISENEPQTMAYLFFFWIVGIILLIHIYQKRKTYFKPGTFFYSIEDVKLLFSPAKLNTNHSCYFCKNKKADAKPHKVYLIKVKGVSLENRGPLQHKSGYKRHSESVKIPRSRKAYIIHGITTVFKIIMPVIALIFLDISSVLWRIVLGFFAGGILSFLLLLVTKTKSKVSYLLSYGMIIKIVVWVGVLSIFSSFTAYNITTTGHASVVLIFLIFLDPFLKGFLKMPGNHILVKPVFKQHPQVNILFNNKYQLYLDVQVWTFIYPLFKWIWG